MYQPLTEQQYNSALKAGFTPSQIIANEQIRKQKESASSATSTPAPTTDNPQYVGGSTAQNAANSTAQFLGVQKAGASIATALRTPAEIGATGTQEGQMAKDQQMIINKRERRRYSSCWNRI